MIKGLYEIITFWVGGWEKFSVVGYQLSVEKMWRVESGEWKVWAG